MQPVALKTPRKMLPDMVWPGGQQFSKNFNTIAEDFYPGIKIFGGQFFFLTQTATQIIRKRKSTKL